LILVKVKTKALTSDISWRRHRVVDRYAIDQLPKIVCAPRKGSVKLIIHASPRNRTLTFPRKSPAGNNRQIVALVDFLDRARAPLAAPAATP
jgi:hypothetical protein